MAGINRLYSSFLASWYPLLTPVEDYKKEAAIYTELLLHHDPEMKSILELGCGAGHNVYYMKNTCLSESNPGKAESKPGQQLRNAGKAFVPSNVYIEYVNNTQRWRYEMMENVNRVVEVKELPETTLAYVRYVGPYKGDGQLFEGRFGKFFQWAGPRNLLRFPETKTIIIYHDNPEITDELQASPILFL